MIFAKIIIPVFIGKYYILRESYTCLQGGHIWGSCLEKNSQVPSMNEFGWKINGKIVTPIHTEIPLYLSKCLNCHLAVAPFTVLFHVNVLCWISPVQLCASVGANAMKSHTRENKNEKNKDNSVGKKYK